MRITKEADERRNEILDAAGKLFMQKGYDKTSTNEILEAVGIARGTLYYHFKSKEDIMDALIERYTQEIVIAAREIAQDKTIPVIERFLKVIAAIKVEEGVEGTMLEEIHKPQNALMHQKMNRAIINGITPVFTEVVEDGIKEGLFETPYAYDCMEMTITYANVAFDNDVIDMTNEERERKMTAMFYNVERMLGAKQGTVLGAMNRPEGR